MMTVMMMIYALLIVDKWSNVSVDVIQMGAIMGCTNIEPINVGKPAPYLLDYIIIAKHKCCDDDRSRICMYGR
jgi:hypothetical protein